MIGFLFGVLKRIVMFFVLACILLVVLFLLGPHFISQEQLKDFLITKAREQTGKELALGGDVSFSLFPTAHLGASNIGVTDPITNTTQTLDSLELDISMMDLMAGNLGLDGLVKLQGQWIEFSLDIDQHQRLFQEKPAHYTLRTTYAGITARSEGMVEVRRDFKQVALSDATIAINTMQGKGGIVVNVEEEIPQLQAKLAFDTLDVNSLMGLAGAPLAVDVKTPSPATNTPSQTTPQSFWSNAPLPLPTLQGIHADIAIQVKNLILDKETLAQQVDVGLLAREGRANLSVNSGSFFGGTARVLGAMDQTGKLPALSGQVELKETDFGALLKRFRQIDWLEGTGDVSLTTNGYGTSQQQLIQSLSGSGFVNARAGKIKGFNLQALGNLESVVGSLLLGGQEQSTEISTLYATVNVAQGIVQNTDMQMRSPFASVAGTGQIDLPNMQIDYTIQPQLQAAGKAASPGPIRITGSLLDPKIKADIDAFSLLQNAADSLGIKGTREMETLKKVQENLDKIPADIPAAIQENVNKKLEEEVQKNIDKFVPKELLQQGLPLGGLPLAVPQEAAPPASQPEPTQQPEEKTPEVTTQDVINQLLNNTPPQFDPALLAPKPQE